MKINALILILFLPGLNSIAQTKTYPYNNRLKDEMVKDGLYKLYYENGNLNEKGTYLEDKKVALWEEYYEDGNIKSRYLIRKDTSYYCQYWDTNGDSILSHGNGILYSSENKLKRNVTTQFKDSLIYSSFFTFFDSFDTIYVVLNKLPELLGEYSIQAKYPTEARRNGTMGNVYVEFIISATGKVENIKVVKGIGSGCDEEAKSAVIRSSGKWIPGEHEGKKVKTIRVLPIYFRLE